MPSHGWCAGTRSTISTPHARETRWWPGPGSARPSGSLSSGTRRSFAGPTGGCWRGRVRYGYRSMREPAAPCGWARMFASAFRLPERPQPGRGAETLMRFPLAFRVAGWLLTAAGVIYLVLGVGAVARGAPEAWSFIAVGLVGIVVGTGVLRWVRRNLQP